MSGSSVLLRLLCVKPCVVVLQASCWASRGPKVWLRSSVQRTARSVSTWLWFIHRHPPWSAPVPNDLRAGAPAHLTVSPEPPPPLPSHCILCASLISLLHAAPTPLASMNPKAEDSTAHWMTSTLCTSCIEIAFYCIVSLLLHACNVLHSTIVRITFLFVFVILVSATRGCSAPRPNGTKGTKAHKLCASMTFLPCLVSRVHGEIQMKKTWMLLVLFRTWG